MNINILETQISSALDIAKSLTFLRSQPQSQLVEGMISTMRMLLEFSPIETYELGDIEQWLEYDNGAGYERRKKEDQVIAMMALCETGLFYDYYYEVMRDDSIITDRVIGSEVRRAIAENDLCVTSTAGVMRKLSDIDGRFIHFKLNDKLFDELNLIFDYQ